MNRVQFALFPAMLLGILAVVLFASLARTSEDVHASAILQEGPTAVPTLTAQLPLRATEAGSSTPSGSGKEALPTAKPTGTKIATVAPTQPAAKPASADCPISSRYPAAIRQWCALIDQYARQAGLDANLIAAVMLQESGGNPKAYSSSGAVGLMQIMPRDGLATRFQCNGKPCFSSRPSMAELYDPAYNISYGVRMLAGLIQRTGSQREALHSYGPMDVGYTYADKVLNIYKNYK